MTLEQWESNGWLRRHQTGPEEIKNLLMIIDRDLEDARGAFQMTGGSELHTTLRSRSAQFCSMPRVSRRKESYNITARFRHCL